MSSEDQQDKGTNGRDPKSGKFVKGWKGGPGRPSGHVDLLAVCRRRAAEEDVDLDELVWATAKAMFKKAMGGDTQAARIVLDRFVGPVRQELDVNGVQTIEIADQARKDFAELAKRSGYQAAVLDELERRSN